MYTPFIPSSLLLAYITRTMSKFGLGQEPYKLKTITLKPQDFFPFYLAAFFGPPS